ncbi:MAG: hypothetical protein LWX51_17275, partial [Deltaproteobacteria bacterium]|nr:hypothetical protein [Deltaproteobacteria bacterium]
MKNFLAFLCAMILVFGMVGNASAALYSYDFSAMGYSDGQILEGMTLDSATFTSETQDLRYYTDYGGGVGTGYGIGAAGDTYINFSIAINELSFTGGDGAGDND